MNVRLKYVILLYFFTVSYRSHCFGPFTRFLNQWMKSEVQVFR